VASDFSATRRKLARQCGSQVAIDPAHKPPNNNWQEFGFITRMNAGLKASYDAKESMEKLPVPWW